MTLLELIQEKSKEIPSFDQDYDLFRKEYKKKVKKILDDVFYTDKMGLEFKNGVDQDGILFAFYDKDEQSRKPVFYEGTIWSDEGKKNKFYNVFNLYKQKFKTTIVDFLLFTEKILIPSKLTVINKNKEEYDDGCSEFRMLCLPILQLDDNYTEIKKILSKIDVKIENYDYENKLKVEYKDKNGNTNIKELNDLTIGKFDQACNELLKQCDDNLLDKVKKNLKSVGIILPDVQDIDERLKNSIIMHTLSEYARNLLIFSSGTYDNVSGLIFTAVPSENKDSNWCKIKNHSNVLLYLDGVLRQITVAEIKNEENVLKSKFLEDYKKRSRDYETLGKIVVAIFSSLNNLYDEKIHDIQMRIKDVDSLLNKINSKYGEYYQKRDYESLYFEKGVKKNNVSCKELEKNDDNSKIGDAPDNVITDLCGVRVIFNYKDEIKTFKSKLCHYFVLYEYENKEYTNNEKGNYFGYTSHHFILGLNQKSIDFFVDCTKSGDNESSQESDKNKDESPWRQKLSSMVFELQLRSLLEHSWADASHDLSYKADESKMDKVEYNQLDKEWQTAKGKIDEADKTILEIKNKILNPNQNDGNL